MPKSKFVCDKENGSYLAYFVLLILRWVGMSSYSSYFFFYSIVFFFFII